MCHLRRGIANVDLAHLVRVRVRVDGLRLGLVLGLGLLGVRVTRVRVFRDVLRTIVSIPNQSWSKTIIIPYFKL